MYYLKNSYNFIQCQGHCPLNFILLCQIVCVYTHVSKQIFIFHDICLIRNCVKTMELVLINCKTN